MREIVFDTETTGFDPVKGDRMVEIGCIELVNRVETGRTFQSYFNPMRAMPKAAEDVHGLSDVFLSDKPLFADMADDLLEFLGEAPLVAHNANFDFGFLNYELTACGKATVAMERMVDTLAIAKVRHPGAKLTLDALCTRYGIDRSHRVKHGALLDAELLTQLYIELTGGRQIGLGLAAVEEDRDSAQAQNGPLLRTGSKPYRAPRHFAVPEDEAQRHEEFIAKIDNALWNAGRTAASGTRR